MVNIKPTSVLLVEDSESDAMLMIQMLSEVHEFDHILDHVQTLNEAVTSFNGEHHECIILDLNLPDSNGLATYANMRATASNTPIIIVTGMEDRDILAQALTSGADNYLIKDKADGSRIAIAILSSIRNRSKNPG
ncbi:MAG: response regulator [Candidatus Obscuribacterales bacterium]|jgi:DNA-binding response OmpR family regulator